MYRIQIHAVLALAAFYLGATICQAHAFSGSVQNGSQQRILLQEAGEEKDYDYLIPYHGWMMTTAFGILFPLGVCFPIIFKGTRFWPIAFKFHLVIQVLGGLFIAAGLGLGAKLALPRAHQHIHRGIGIAVFALVWFQIVLSVSIRPLLHNKPRGLFNVIHWWFGRTALVVGIGNAYYGLNISHPGTRWYVGFSVAIGGILLIAVIGQLLVHALFYNYDHEGHVVLTPAENEKGTVKNTYQHVVAHDGVPYHRNAPVVATTTNMPRTTNGSV